MNFKDFFRKNTRFMVLVTLIFLVRGTFADQYWVPSGSMLPTIQIGDLVLTNKMAYDLKLPFTQVSLMRTGEPQRGDIVVFTGPADGKRLVKRFVGMPGDQIEIRAGEIYINHEYMGTYPEGDVTRTIIIPKDRYFAMGDNRGNSLDSRYWGFVPRENILAKAHHVAFNLSRFGQAL